MIRQTANQLSAGKYEKAEYHYSAQRLFHVEHTQQIAHLKVTIAIAPSTLGGMRRINVHIGIWKCTSDLLQFFVRYTDSGNPKTLQPCHFLQQLRVLQFRPANIQTFQLLHMHQHIHIIKLTPKKFQVNQLCQIHNGRKIFHRDLRGLAPQRRLYRIVFLSVYGKHKRTGNRNGSLFTFLQTKQLLFLCVKFFLRNDTAIEQFLILFQFVGMAGGFVVLNHNFFLYFRGDKLERFNILHTTAAPSRIKIAFTVRPFAVMTQKASALSHINPIITITQPTTTKERKDTMVWDTPSLLLLFRSAEIRHITVPRSRRTMPRIGHRLMLSIRLEK